MTKNEFRDYMRQYMPMYRRIRRNNDPIFKAKEQDRLLNLRIHYKGSRKRRSPKTGIRRLIAEKKNRPCEDCRGWFPPIAMTYDHRDPKTKIYTLSAMRHKSLSVEAVLNEISKCDVVCANCHAIRTQKQWETGILVPCLLKTNNKAISPTF